MNPAESPLEAAPLIDGKDPGYSRRFLRVYDQVVFGINMPFFWRCPKGKFLDFYDEHVSSSHLDIGVGTGYLLDRCHFPTPDPEITLMDFSQNALDFAGARLERYAPKTRRGSVIEAWNLPAESFESVGMINLLHCVPGSIQDCAVAFEEAGSVLAPGGTLFGATVLNAGVTHTWLSRRAMNSLNRRGIFCNMEDSLKDLEACLSRTFEDYQVDVQGAMALFSARSSRA